MEDEVLRGETPKIFDRGLERMVSNLKQQEIIAEAMYDGISDDKADPEDKGRSYRTTQTNQINHCPKKTASSPPHLLASSPPHTTTFLPSASPQYPTLNTKSGQQHVWPECREKQKTGLQRKDMDSDRHL